MQRADGGLRTGLLFVEALDLQGRLVADEAGCIAAWLDKGRQLAQQLPPGARWVKATTEAMLFDLPDPAAAWPALLRWLGEGALPLRCGLHWAEVQVTDYDVLGSGVNLAARLSRLGAPGALVFSEALGERLPGEVAGEVEDLGACYLKHWPEPVRAFSVRARATSATAAPSANTTPPPPTPHSPHAPGPSSPG